MLPLTLDDLIPLEEFAGRRGEFLESHGRYVDRYRRVRLGPSLTVIFENRQTLWYRVQEIIRIARLTDPRRLQQELNIYNRLLPERDCLQAALIIEITDPTKLVKELEPWQNIQGEHLRLCLGEWKYFATLVTSRPEDRTIGAAHWVRFQMDQTGQQLLSDLSQAAFLEFESPHYQQQSSSLGEDVRQSLLDDLLLSGQDEKVA